ncbi:MAG TPA: cytochrome c peroxidase [Candidatus Binatia bacterium]|nr:cytochrome c peroxidase [Candidatus Binatia bacterium]
MSRAYLLLSATADPPPAVGSTSQPAASIAAIVAEEPITPIQEAPSADPRKVALGEKLFFDPRLSHDGGTSCNSCHDVRRNGASRNIHDGPIGGAGFPFNTPTVFNAAGNFRLGWQGGFRTLQAQAVASIDSPRVMRSSPQEAAAKLAADPELARQFHAIYGRDPDPDDLIDALATFERSLVTPGSRFDRWLMGDTGALGAEELAGYQLFKSVGCISCHQGANVGGNLFQRHGIFHPLASPDPPILRVPSLRNVATTAPYFHDGSAPTLETAVRRMAYAQLDSSLTDQQVGEIVAFLRTLTGDYRGRPVGEGP